MADQRDHPPYGTNLTFPLEDYVQLHQTSGTTGVPLRVLDTAADWAWWRSMFARTLATAGVGAPTAPRSPSRSARTCISGRRRRGCRSSVPWPCPLGGMTSVARLQTIGEVRPRR